MTQRITQSLRVPPNAAGHRLDQIAAELFPDFSRSKLQSWIKQGDLQADGRQLKPNAKLAGGELLTLDVELQPEGEWLPQDIGLDIVYEDDSILVINKAAGLVVHPAAGNWQGTLLNALLHHRPEQELLPRAGIVHRLDKDTSGLMVVAKTPQAQNALVDQLQARSVSRTYLALVYGHVSRADTVETLIDRHPSKRTLMAVVKSGGKEAITHYKPLAYYGYLSLVECKLETGRTHQIRVHMSHLGFPLVGDQVYRRDLSAGLRREYPDLAFVDDFPRQALHAKRLGLLHPLSGKPKYWQCALPADMQNLQDHLEALYPCS